MNILCIGDVCGKTGCETLRTLLPAYKKIKQVDLCVVNGENAADGNGLLPAAAEHLFASGADVITGGNHTLRRAEIYAQLEENPALLRPDNFPSAAPGRGYTVIDCGYARVAVLNLMGTVYLESLDNPFEAADRLLARAKADGASVTVLDFHAEATSEKRAMGFYLDGRCSAVFGTHTHVQTADAQVLPKGTGYITDLGMTGPRQSVLGVQPSLAIKRQKDKMPVRFAPAQGETMLCGCLFSVDQKTGRAAAAEAVCLMQDPPAQERT